MAEEIPQAQPQPQAQAQPQAQPDFLSGLIDALMTGAQHTYGQVKDDLGSLLQGGYNPGTAGRVGEAAMQLPLMEWLGKLGPAVNAGIAGIKRPPMRPAASPVPINMEELMQALTPGGAYAAKAAVRNAPAAGTAALDVARRAEVQMPMAGTGAAASLPRTGKTFAAAPEASGGYGKQLLEALQSYLNPEELRAAKARMKPALLLGEGEPSALNTVLGPVGGNHPPLYEAVQGMKGSITHGYQDKVFLDNALNTLLYDPSMLQKAVDLLKGGTLAKDLATTLGYGSSR